MPDAEGNPTEADLMSDAPTNGVVQGQETESTPPAEEGATPAQAESTVYKTSDGREIPTSEVEKMLKDFDAHKKQYESGYNREYQKKRITETNELKSLRDELGKTKTIADQARALEAHLRANNPELFKQFAATMAQVGGSVNNSVQTETHQTTPTMDPELQELILDNQANRFEASSGLKLTPQQRSLVFETMLDHEKQGIKLPFDKAAKIVLFDSFKDRAALKTPKPVVKPALGGSASQGARPKAPTPADERAEWAKMMGQ